MENYPELLRTLLLNRGIHTQEEAERFMKPDYERDLHDPFLMHGMEKAVKRILKAFKKKEKIVVYGDYDCDGIPGSVVLYDFFSKIGCDHFFVYIPHRYREGYGLNTSAVEKFADEGVKLVITVDSGITDVEQVRIAQERGVDVIVTDHHLPQAELPPAHVILNSKQECDPYPFKLLSGAGVAFKLVQALLMRMRSKGDEAVPVGWEKWLLDVAGISTIADMVPLVGENRALAHFGLRVLRQTRRPGLRALFSKARVDATTLTEDDVGFTIGPRINAASRMDEPIRAFELLSTRNEVDAISLAHHLEKKNTERKATVGEMIAEVDALVHSRGDAPVLVVGSEEWRPGVVGLAASRIVEKYNRAAFVWGGAGSTNLKGSCRSDGTVNIVRLMENAVPGTFLDFGGHVAAGGFSLLRENAGFLEKNLFDAHGKTDRIAGLNKEQKPDLTLSLDEVSWDTYRMIEKLAPFGEGNPKPLFLLQDVSPSSVERFGKAKEHLKAVFRGKNGPVSAISFFWGNKKDPQPGMPLSFTAHIESSSFGRGRPELRLRFVELF